MTTNNPAAPRREPVRLAAEDMARPSARWLLIPLALVLGAALLGYVAEPPDRDAQGFAAPEVQRSVEDWRGNSASFERVTE